MKIALIIGRFQLVGNHHVDMFKQIEKYHTSKIESNRFKRICVGIATPDKKDSETQSSETAGASELKVLSNPFEPKDCLNMIKPIAENTANKLKVELQLKIIPDINDIVRYNFYVAEMFGFNLDQDEIIVFSENPWTISCFERRKAYSVVVVEEKIKTHSTLLRKMWFEREDLSKYVPVSTLKYLNKIKKNYLFK